MGCRSSADRSVPRWVSWPLSRIPNGMRRAGLGGPVWLAVLALGALSLTGRAQTRYWIWMSGSNALTCASVGDGGTYCQQPGSYGSLGVAASTNSPSGRSDAANWIDGSGNLWLFGGQDYDAAWLEDDGQPGSSSGFLNDLWKFNPATQQWTWMGGSSTEDQSGVYGTLGAASSASFPGARAGVASWIDGSGDLWLFGGEGYDANYGESGFLNDLWKYAPSSGQWTWMGGSNTLGSSALACRPGVYGALGSASAGNIPGGRMGALGWTDKSGNRWLFGGMGCDAAGNFGALNDLWEFIATTRQWAWMSGSNSLREEDAAGDYGRNGVYGNLGQAAPSNVPGGRYGGASWIDGSGNLWLFGGQGYDSLGTMGFLNDLWEFNPGSEQWVWMGGSSAVPVAAGGVGGEPGAYGTQGVTAASSIPGGRAGAAGWSDGDGNFWLLGGGGRDGNDSYGGLNDLWELNPSTRAWTWMGGSNTVMQPGAYGNLGIPSGASVPGGRIHASSWNDQSGNLWTFGGLGYDSNGSFGMLNDLWVEGVTSAAPSFTPAPGVYNGTEYVSISASGANAAIYLTTDGTPPTSNAALYTAPVKLMWSSETVQAIAAAPGLLPSTAAVATYTLNAASSTPAATPVFSPAGGVFASAQPVTITDATPGSAIYYTTDESTPTASSNLYTGPITVSSYETLKATAVAAGYLNSAMATATLNVLPSAATLTVSGSDPYNMTCAVTGPALKSVPGPTGKITFTDTTTNQTLGTATLGTGAISRAFQAQATYRVGDVPTGIAFGDFNGDGKMDLAVTNNADATISILLNNGDGTFQMQTVYPVLKGPVGISAGDFNGDGKLDLAVADGSGSSLSVLLGNGNGAFQAQKTTSAGTNPREIVVGDFNGDGNLDVATTDSYANQLSVLLGNGDGTFQTRKAYALGNNPQGIVTGFFAGNQKPLDLVEANENDSTLSVLMGNGDGTFQSQSVVANEAGSLPIAMTAADFNGDGNLDLAIASNDTVTVLLGNGDGTFQYSPALVTPVSPVNPKSIAAGDFNGDGVPDLAVTDGNSATVLILTGNGNGTFQTGNAYAVGAGPIGMVAADLNGDGNPDLAIANSKANTISVLLSYAAAVASASLTNVSVNGGTSGTHNLRCSYSGDANYPASTSNTVTESYSQVATPAFSLLVGDYPAAQPVSISDATPGAIIYYTSDGSTPTTSSTRYTGPITVSSSVKLRAIATLMGQEQSAISEVTYAIAAAPSFTSSASGASGLRLPIASGRGARALATRLWKLEAKPEASTAPQTVTITDQSPGATIYYTTDGSTPSTQSAIYTSPLLLTGTATLTAFAAAPGYVNSPVASATYTVAQPATPTVKLTATPSAISAQTSVTLAATVAGGGATPTGAVSFLDGAANLGESTLSTSGVATLTVNSLSVGTHSIVANYAGDSNYAAATSAAVSVTVSPLVQAITFAPLASPVPYGTGPLTLNANASSGLAVAFAATGPATISEGRLSITGAGTVVVTVSQSGNDNYAAAAPVSQTIAVNKANPTISLKDSAGPAIFGPGALGSAITFTATVAGVGAIPSGSVTFYSGSTELATAELNGSGAAAYATSRLGMSKRSITASYEGDANYTAAVSTALAVTISNIGHIHLPFRFGGTF